MTAAELIERLEALTPAHIWIVSVQHQTGAGASARASLFSGGPSTEIQGYWTYPEHERGVSYSIEPEHDVLEHLFRIVRAGLVEMKRAAEAKLAEEHLAERAERIMDEVEGRPWNDISPAELASLLPGTEGTGGES